MVVELMKKGQCQKVSSCSKDDNIVSHTW